LEKRALTEAERLDWLQLMRTSSIGPITFFRLMNRFGSADEALTQLPSISPRKLEIYPRARAEAELKRAWKTGALPVAACEPEYPGLLRAIADPPPLIYVQGHLSLVERPCVALIGARNASALGLKLAGKLARELGQLGYVICSGLARGIDGAAHHSALQTGTIAVVAGGIDRIYPPEHAELHRCIVDAGLVVSERPPGAEPTAQDFPRRNRLISGLSRGVVVIEAAERSGTLITTRFASDQGREVFAVPGSPLDPRSQGPNRLLKDGATLVETADDIHTVLQHQLPPACAEEADDAVPLFAWTSAQNDAFREAGAPGAPIEEALRARLFELIGHSPAHQDDLQRLLGVPPGVFADLMLDLVLSGEITESGGGTFTRMAHEPPGLTA